MGTSNNENDRTLGGIGTIAALKNYESQLTQNGGFFGGKKSPDSVIAVLELALALAKYNAKDLSDPEIASAGIIIEKLKSHIKDFSTFLDTHPDKKSEAYKAALEQFNKSSSKTLSDNFQTLAAADTYSNAIKILFNSAFKALGYQPPFKLDASGIIQDKDIKGKFKNISQHEHLKIIGKKEVNVSLEEYEQDHSTSPRAGKK